MFHDQGSSKSQCVFTKIGHQSNCLGVDSVQKDQSKSDNHPLSWSGSTQQPTINQDSRDTLLEVLYTCPWNTRRISVNIPFHTHDMMQSLSRSPLYNSIQWCQSKAYRTSSSGNAFPHAPSMEKTWKNPDLSICTWIISVDTSKVLVTVFIPVTAWMLEYSYQ